MATIDDLIARAQAYATQLVQAQISDLPAVRSTSEALHTLAQVEIDIRGIGTDLLDLNQAGLLTSADQAAFDQLRANTKAAQARLLAFVRNIFADQPQVLAQLPTTTQLAPALSDPIYQTPPPTNPSTNAIGPWGIAGIVVAILIALGLMVYLGTKMYESFDGLVDLYVLQEQTRQLRALYDARTAALQACIQDRQRQQLETTSCYGYVEQLVPTPQSALAQRPDPSSSNAIWWFLGGLATFGVVLGVGIYLAKASEKKRLEGYREVSGSQLLDARDDYNLELDDA
jgi:hypothetical protein